MKKFVLELSIGPLTPESKGEVARYWLDGALSKLRPEMIARLDSQSPIPSTDQPLPEMFVGGSLALITWKPRRGGRGDGITRYSTAQWKKFMTGLDDDYMHASLAAYAISSPTTVSSPYFEVKAQAIPEEPDWVHLVVATTVEEFNYENESQLWIDFCFDAANALSPIFGHSTDDSEDLRTMQERELRWFPFETIPNGHVKLRGESWITVIPKSLVSRLGGVNGIRESGAFYDVRELAGGGAVVQASRYLEEYPQVRARIREVLRPVLI
ncbi:hypothetical protein [Catenulispora pinisilvae]|uniref:hypothetical protein n=1 Tax=Catenulispora pinisilvae TaxID=2705253 RepID=UPI0018919541|nr:hypothetical protein [Catenulispora pinisilvae]